MPENAAIETLLAKQAIQETLYRYCRALDRLDRDLLQGLFADDAHIDYGNIYQGDAGGFVDVAIDFQGSMRDTQHCVSNILIEVDGGRASAESYVYAHHVLQQGDELMELVIGARYLDRFERIDGNWLISQRTEVLDWARMLPIPERWYEENSELPKGERGRGDLSYRYL